MVSHRFHAVSHRFRIFPQCSYYTGQVQNPTHVEQEALPWTFGLPWFLHRDELRKTGTWVETQEWNFGSHEGGSSSEGYSHGAAIDAAWDNWVPRNQEQWGSHEDTTLQ